MRTAEVMDVATTGRPRQVSGNPRTCACTRVLQLHVFLQVRTASRYGRQTVSAGPTAGLTTALNTGQNQQFWSLARPLAWPGTLENPVLRPKMVDFCPILALQEAYFEALLGLKIPVFWVKIGHFALCFTRAFTCF